MNTNSLTRNTLNDPMVLSVEQNDEALPSHTSTKSDSITSFFERLNQSMKSVDLGTPQARDNNAPQLPPYTADYKPKDCINKKHVYSINELLSISKQIPEGASEEIVNSLPKKKFWRLNRRYSDHGNHTKGLGHRNGRGFNAGVNSRPTSNEEGVFERRNSKSKGTRPKRGNKHGKNDKNGFLLEEKDIAVNNEDLLALEGEFEPTGNSMADFETWKAKMKEMELKKKGLIGNDVVRTDPVPEVSITSSSISDFLKLNTKKAESTADISNSPKDVNPRSDKVGIEKREGQTESSAGASSRFSSFFNNSASSVSLPPKPTEVSKEQTVNNNSESTSSVSSGSRLMSFFNKDQERREQTPVYPNNSNEQPKFMPPPPGLARQDEAKGQHTLPAQFAMPPMQGARPQQSQTNNAFFQGLLNKGKLSDSPVSTPPGIPVPNNAPPLLNQAQRLGQGPPRNVGVPPGFCIGMPPPGFGPPMQGGSIQGPNRLPMMTNVPKESGSSESSVKKKGPQQQSLPQRQMPMQPGMYPQFVPGMAPPPGFPLMQGMPQGFNPNMFPPSNGMMPSNGQQFFPQPPLPPPQAGVPPYNSFSSQHNAAQEGKTK